MPTTRSPYPTPPITLTSPSPHLTATQPFELWPLLGRDECERWIHSCPVDSKRPIHSIAFRDALHQPTTTILPQIAPLPFQTDLSAIERHLFDLLAALESTEDRLWVVCFLVDKLLELGQGVECLRAVYEGLEDHERDVVPWIVHQSAFWLVDGNPSLWLKSLGSHSHRVLVHLARLGSCGLLPMETVTDLIITLAAGDHLDKLEEERRLRLAVEMSMVCGRGVRIKQASGALPESVLALLQSQIPAAIRSIVHVCLTSHHLDLSQTGLVARLLTLISFSHTASFLTYNLNHQTSLPSHPAEEGFGWKLCLVAHLERLQVIPLHATPHWTLRLVRYLLKIRSEVLHEKCEEALRGLSIVLETSGHLIMPHEVFVPPLKLCLVKLERILRSPRAYLLKMSIAVSIQKVIEYDGYSFDMEDVVVENEG